MAVYSIDAKQRQCIEIDIYSYCLALDRQRNSITQKEQHYANSRTSFAYYTPEPWDISRHLTTHGLCWQPTPAGSN